MQGMLLPHQSKSTRMIGLPKWRTRWPLVPSNDAKAGTGKITKRNLQVYASVKKVVCSSRGPNALIVSVRLRDAPAACRLLVAGCWAVAIG